MLLPIPGVFVPLYLLLNKLHLLDTRLGLILCYINGGLAFGIFLLRSFFEELPIEIEEAALIDGASRFRDILANSASARRACNRYAGYI